MSRVSKWICELDDDSEGYVSVMGVVVDVARRFNEERRLNNIFLRLDDGTGVVPVRSTLKSDSGFACLNEDVLSAKRYKSESSFSSRSGEETFLNDIGVLRLTDSAKALLSDPEELYSLGSLVEAVGTVEMEKDGRPKIRAFRIRVAERNEEEIYRNLKMAEWREKRKKKGS